MKKKLDGGLLRRAAGVAKRHLAGDVSRLVLREYGRRFRRYAFTDLQCKSYEQFEASITRLYHTLEKGLAHEDYRAGFGRENIEYLVASMEQYVARGYDTAAFFYETALSCLHAYVLRNAEHGHVDAELETRIGGLPGVPNGLGGAIEVSRPVDPGLMNYDDLVTSRHSVRRFSGEPVDIGLLEEALVLAQRTPSACNRQGWRTRVVADKATMSSVLENQNGNRGFGDEIDKLLVVTADLRAQQKSREVFQAFIDGGMYAQSVLNCLHAKGIASVPLSASLTASQERAVRRCVGIDDAEVLILFVGVGSYPDESVLTTRSERRPRTT